MEFNNLNTFNNVENRYQLPATAWLRVTDYIHGWLQHELGGAIRIGEQYVVCVQHLQGARKILRMETVEDMARGVLVKGAMSGTMHNCIQAGMKIDAGAVQDLYGISVQDMKLYVPIECPKMCLTANGVLRPWTLEVCFSKEQAQQLLALLRGEFWKAVAEFDRMYAAETGDTGYPVIDMVEEFCKFTGTASYHAETIRREWLRQRRMPDECQTEGC